MMQLAKHAGAWLIVFTLVYALLTYSPRWPEVVVGIVGAGCSPWPRWTSSGIATWRGATATRRYDSPQGHTERTRSRP